MKEDAEARAVEPWAIQWASGAAGRVLAAVFAGIRAIRQPRPIHPKGTVYLGNVTRVNPAGRNSGISWIDAPPASGEQEVVVRISRSVGLPPPLPDVLGLAFKFTTERGAADLELASSWFGLPGRFILRPTRSLRGAFGSLMPYRGESGPVLVSARIRDRDGEVWKIDLFHASPSSTWRRFAVVSVKPVGLPDPPNLRFDPVVNPLPGAGTYDWTRRLRQGSYRAARRSPAVPEYTAPFTDIPG
jgi:hypothetical protein